MALTYRKLLRETRALAKEARQEAERHKAMAARVNAEADDCGRIAEQITTLNVDPATVSETRELANIMSGLLQAATFYDNAADETSRAAAAAEQQTRTDHGGINQAAQSSSVPMAAAAWYTQE